MIRSGQAKGEIWPSVNPEELAIFVISLLEGGASSVQNSNDRKMLLWWLKSIWKPTSKARCG